MVTILNIVILLYFCHEKGEKYTMEIKKNVMNVLKKGAERNLKQAANAKCIWFCYEPKAPKNLTKFKRKK